MRMVFSASAAEPWHGMIAAYIIGHGTIAAHMIGCVMIGHGMIAAHMIGHGIIAAHSRIFRLKTQPDPFRPSLPPPPHPPVYLAPALQRSLTLPPRPTACRQAS
eukprot:366013-Chlamydomonas_euryale.AAC.3